MNKCLLCDLNAILIAIFIIFFGGFQPFEGKIIYLKRSSDNSDSEIYITSKAAKESYTFFVAEQECHTYSDNYEYIAVSKEDKPKTLDIYRLSTGEPVLSIAWNESWTRPCTFRFDDDTTLAIYTQPPALEVGQNEEIFIVNIFSGEVTGPHTRTLKKGCYGITHSFSGNWWPDVSESGVSCEELTAQLPNLLPGNFYARFPNMDYFLYNRCDAGTGMPDEHCEGDMICGGPGKAVIYDIANQETIEVLRDAFDFSLEDWPHSCFPNAVSSIHYRTLLKTP